MPFAAKRLKCGASLSFQLTNTKKGGSYTNSASAQKRMMCTQSKAGQPAGGGSNKSRKADTEPSFLYSISAKRVSPGPS